jgi:hypothetical protein
LARPATLGATTTPNPVAAELQAKGIAVNPDAVFWEGQSLGGILGTINVAVNPRISEAVLNAPGGTFVDIAATSPAFKAGLEDILAKLPPPTGPILPGSPAFLQFLQVAKWVLDPAEPINFAGRMIGGTDHPTLPDLLAAGAPPQKDKKVLGQLAVCDNTVPNPFNLLLFNVAGVAPPPTATTFQNNGFTTFRNTGTPDPSGVCNALPAPWDTGAVAHGFLLDHGLRPPATSDTNSVTLSLFARTDAADFLNDPAVAQPVLHECTSTTCN